VRWSGRRAEKFRLNFRSWVWDETAVVARLVEDRIYLRPRRMRVRKISRQDHQEEQKAQCGRGKLERFVSNCHLVGNVKIARSVAQNRGKESARYRQVESIVVGKEARD